MQHQGRERKERAEAAELRKAVLEGYGDMIADRIFVLAVRHAVMDLPRRLAELESQLIHEAELMARQIAKRDELGEKA